MNHLRAAALLLPLVGSSLLTSCGDSGTPAAPERVRPSIDEIAAALNATLRDPASKTNAFCDVELRDGVFLDDLRFKAFLVADYAWLVDQRTFLEISSDQPGIRVAGLRGAFQPGDLWAENLLINVTLLRCEKSWQVEDLEIDGLLDPFEFADTRDPRFERLDDLLREEFLRPRGRGI